MQVKIICLLLSIVLFECLNATPLPEKNETSQRKADKRKLVDLILDSYNKLGKLKLDDCKRIAEEVVKDPKLLEHKTETMTGYLNDFRQFIAHVNEFGDRPFVAMEPSNKPEKIMAEQSTLFNQFKEPESEEAELVKASLVKNGIADQWTNVLEPTARTITDELLRQSENYLKSLNEAERQSEKELQTLVENLKKETDPLERIDFMDEYFTRLELTDII